MLPVAPTPKLSICIATYNRAAFLPRTLDSIIGQLTDDVEVVIADGASPDATPEVVRPYLQDPRIHYVRLCEKGGVDRDYDYAVGMARGEFCWLFTDDDLLAPGAVARVLAEITRGRSLIVVNGEIRDAEMLHVLRARTVSIVDDVVFAPSEREGLFKLVGRYLSFIGGVVVRRSIWNTRERPRYYGSEFIHMGVLFQETLPGDAKVIAVPLIRIRHGNHQWLSRAFRVWTVQWRDIIWSFDGLSDSAKAQVCHRTPWEHAGELLQYRARGAYNQQVYQELVAPALTRRCHRAAALAVSRVPESLAAVAMLALSIFESPSDAASRRDYVLHLRRQFTRK